MVSYGWTIDYINDNVTVPQLLYLTKEILKSPPIQLMGYSMGQGKKTDDNIEGKLARFGHVRTEKFFDDESIKSVIRLRDGKRIK